MIKNPLKGKTEYGWHFEQNVYEIDSLVRSLKAGGGSGNIPKIMIISKPRGFRKLNLSAIAPTLTISGFERNNFYIDMAKEYTVKNITLAGKTIPDGSSGGTGYDEYAHLLIEYYNGESQKATIGYYYQNVNLVFQQLYDKLFGCENPEHAHELLYCAIKDFVPAADFNALPNKYKSPKREDATPRKHYRIRKLTPTECLRLMGVSDEDIKKMKAYPFHMLIENPSYSKEEIMAGMTDAEKRRLMKDKISDSQLYKLAGNSIVVPVLEGIFRNMDFKEEPLRVFEAFAGYGSQSMALRNIGVDHEVVGISEIDKYAIMAYNATHPKTDNYGDICQIDWAKVPDFDLFTYSFPCTDISNAGAQAGFEEGSGTRSSLLWECRKAIEEKHPKYLLMENVKAITSKKFLPGLIKWQEFLSMHGYVNFIDVLNAKDYGIPQNRERCFLVSILDAPWYQFPEPKPLTLKLKDILEDNVAEKYYLDQSRVDKFIAGLSDEKREQLEQGNAV